MSDIKIKFSPQGKEVDINPDKSLLRIAQENGVYIKSICNGNATCTECRVSILEGEGNVLPPNKKELEAIGTSYFLKHYRLACQMRCFGPIEIDLSEQIVKQQNQAKRPAGFRASDDSEKSKAKQDIMVLDDGDPALDETDS